MAKNTSVREAEVEVKHYFFCEPVCLICGDSLGHGYSQEGSEDARLDVKLDIEGHFSSRHPDVETDDIPSNVAYHDDET